MAESLLFSPYPGQWVGPQCKKPLSYWIPGDVGDSVSGSIGSFLNGRRTHPCPDQGQSKLPIETFGYGLHLATLRDGWIIDLRATLILIGIGMVNSVGTMRR